MGTDFNGESRIRAFVVEDYLLLRLGLVQALRNNGIDVTGSFASAEECIEALKNDTPDVILMDLGLPQMNGIEATKLIKENYPEMRIIILTSHDKEQKVLACLASGAQAYCIKDIDTLLLVEVIKMVNDGALWLDPKIAKIAQRGLPRP